VVYQGHIENGVVVFTDPVPLADGTPVRVEAVIPPAASFWESCSLDELTRRQGVMPPPSETLIGWPLDELDDGFETVVTSWRQRELEHRR
jgi:hypothetical protein